MRRRAALVFGLFLACVGFIATLCLSARPVAADGDLVLVPDVAGRSVEDAKAALAVGGFLVATYEVDGVPVGSVAAQTPAGGTLRPHGAVVTLDVRVHAQGSDPVPQAVGLATGAASAQFGALYDLVFQSVPGAAGDRGKVVAQAPAAGAPLAKRGRLTLSFVPDDALPASVPVPSVAGGAPADAIQAIADAGLHARVSHIALPGTPPDVVVGQSPLPGTEAPRYATVDVVITAEAAGEATAQSGPVAVPNVVGMTEASARAALDDAGLDANVEWIDGDPMQAFMVQSQDPAAGAEAAADTAVHIRIVRFGAPAPTPAEPATKVAMPDLVGLSEAQAENVLSSLGLVANPIFDVNGSVPGLQVFAQQLTPGTAVDVGTAVAYRVAQPLPPPAPVPVPDFYGRTKGESLALAAGAGLSLTVLEVVTNSHPPHRVYSQSVGAYSSVPLGAALTVRLARPTAGPALVPVPDLSGRTGPQALAMLSSVGLSGLGTDVVTTSKPFFKVYSQFPPAGVPFPVGLTVKFKIAVPPATWTTVPDVIGQWKIAAVAAINGTGLAANVIEVFAPGKPMGRVFEQDPAGGAVRPPGSPVTIRVAKALSVAVPNVVGKTTAQAMTLLSAAGLAPDVHVAPHPPPAGIVYDQMPNAGVLVAPGSTVKIWVPIGLGPAVVVPNLFGKTQAQALVILNGVGLASNVTLVTTLAHPAGRVYSQTPIAGASVAAGTVVTIVVAQLLPGPALVVVPNVFGMTKPAAIAALAAKGLVADVHNVSTLGHPFNLVFDQAPNAFTLSSPGATVVVKIAVPGGLGVVPNVVGLTPLQSKNAIEAAGFVSSGSNVPMLFKPHGRTYWQNKPAGASLALGTTISWRWNP